MSPDNTPNAKAPEYRWEKASFAWYRAGLVIGRRRGFRIGILIGVVATEIGTLIVHFGFGIQ